MSKIKISREIIYTSTTGRKFFTKRGAVRCSIAAIIRKNFGNCDCRGFDGSYNELCKWHENGDASKLIDKWYKVYVWISKIARERNKGIGVFQVPHIDPVEVDKILKINKEGMAKAILELSKHGRFG